MATLKKPNYPVIRRVPRLPQVHDRTHISTNQTKYLKRRWADWTIKSTGDRSIYLDETLSVNTVLEEKSYINNPSWRTKIAKGQDSGANYGRSIFAATPTKYVVTSENSSNKSSGYGVTLGDGGDDVALSWTALDDKALGRLKHKLDGYIGNAQLAAPLAESREIHRLVRQINGLGLSTVKSLLAIRKTRGKSAFKQFADVWLGFGFGVNPMIKDIESAATAILNYQHRTDRRVRVSGTASGERFSGSNNLTGQEPVAFGASIGFATNVHHQQGVRYVAAVDIQVRSAASYSVADHLGLEISQIPSTLWELTPFSWVVDYFTTVSPWLDDMFYTLPGQTIYVYKNHRYEYNVVSTPKFFPTSGYTVRGYGTDTKKRGVTFSRESLGTALPTRSLRIKSVDEIANHGITKLLNLASVLAGRRGPKL